MPSPDRRVSTKVGLPYRETAMVEPRIERLPPGISSQHLARIGLNPKRSEWDGAGRIRLRICDTGEFAEARPWRDRKDILEVLELTSGPNCLHLLDDLSRRFAAQGGQLVLVYGRLFWSNEAIFRQVGFALLEEIVEMTSVRPFCDAKIPDRVVRFERERDPIRLLTIDREAFSWLWCNSRHEMSNYLKQAGVRAFTAISNDVLAGYVSFTVHRDFAHIDRLAVLPEQQGQGIGKALMRWSLGEIRESGRENVILTTQSSNTRSQSLYRSFGFSKTQGGYSIYGKWL